MTDDDELDKLEAIDKELFELIEQFYPGALTTGEIPNHPLACAALANALGMLLVWRLIKSEESLVDAIDSLADTMYKTAHSRYEIARQVKMKMAEGTGTKQ
jgi:hypothetical protein